MTKPELVTAIGQPENTMSPAPNIEVLTYVFKKQRLYRLAFPLSREYLVRLDDGHVSAYGNKRELSKSGNIYSSSPIRQPINNAN